MTPASLFRPPPVAFAADEIGLDAFGWNVESATLVAPMGAAAGAAKNVQIVPSLAEGLEPGEDLAEASSSNGSTLKGRIVIPADGRNSRLPSRSRRFGKDVVLSPDGVDHDHLA